MAAKSASDLYKASAAGDLSAVKLLLTKGVSVNSKVPNGSSSLYAASYNGHTEVVNLLLSKGADIHARDNDGYNSIQAASQNGHTEVVNLLLSKGADIHARSNNGFTALHIASQNGHVPVAETLLRHGANLEAKTTVGDRLTPVGIASIFGDDHMVEFLVKQGAILDAGDRMPVDLAAKLLNKEKRTDIKKILSKPGAFNSNQMIKEVEAFVDKLLRGKVQVIDEWRIIALKTMHPDPVILKLCAVQVLSLEDKHQFEGKDVYAKVKLLIEKVDSSRKQELVTALVASNYHSNVSIAKFITGHCVREETFLSEKDVASILKEFSEDFVENVTIDDLRDQLISKLILDQTQWEELEARQTRTQKANYLLDHVLLRGTVQSVCGFYSAFNVCKPVLSNILRKAVPNIIAKNDNV